jgi:hypothetical protein
MRRGRLSLVFLVSAGCAGGLGEGEADFKNGRYPEAKQSFSMLEAESRGYGPAKRAEYSLYRGLTLAALGDRGQADVWLREAVVIEAAHPGALSDEDRSRLKLAIDANQPP